ncbi:MAG: hypothetical protein PVF91_10360 [Chromatiales bacterium]|jgi:hypothetical protein
MRTTSVIITGLLAILPAGPCFAEITDEGLRQVIEMRARAMDTDRDGTVSRSEYLANARREFARMDLDGNGRITAAERHQIAGRLGALRQVLGP